MNFNGKTVVVASVATDRGSEKTHVHAAYGVHIGAACAIDFAKHSAHVVAIDSNELALLSLKNEIEKMGGLIETIHADPSQTESLEKAVQIFSKNHDVAHVLINAPHDTELSNIVNTSNEAWARVIAFDLLGPVYATKAFLPFLKKSGQAAIVNMGSIDGINGNPQIPAYSTAKGGLIPLTHLMADEFAPFGIRVNYVARGMVTPVDAKVINPMFVPLLEHTPISRPAYPHEVTAAVRFLCSSEASYITGIVLPVDGGRLGITPGTRFQSAVQS